MTAVKAVSESFRPGRLVLLVVVVVVVVVLATRTWCTGEGEHRDVGVDEVDGGGVGAVSATQGLLIPLLGRSKTEQNNGNTHLFNIVTSLSIKLSIKLSIAKTYEM